VKVLYLVLGHLLRSTKERNLLGKRLVYLEFLDSFEGVRRETRREGTQEVWRFKRKGKSSCKSLKGLLSSLGAEKFLKVEVPFGKHSGHSPFFDTLRPRIPTTVRINSNFFVRIIRNNE